MNQADATTIAGEPMRIGQFTDLDVFDDFESYHCSYLPEDDSDGHETTMLVTFATGDNAEAAWKASQPIFAENPDWEEISGFGAGTTAYEFVALDAGADSEVVVAVKGDGYLVQADILGKGGDHSLRGTRLMAHNSVKAAISSLR